MADRHHTARPVEHHAAHHDAVHHEHGSMDTTVHERTFDGFIRFMTWNAVAIIAVLIFLALANA